MRDFRDAKLMAKALRDALKPNVDLGHGACLEITAQMFGFKDWNTLSAAIAESQEGNPVEPLLPDGWRIGGSAPELYSVGLDPTVRHGSGTPATVRSLVAEVRIGAFATLLQSISAEAYRGTRIRLQANLRTKDVDGRAAIWLRINSAPDKSIAFDNLNNRRKDVPLSGTQDWLARRIVLDVPDAAESIHFGFTLSGSGQAWAAGFVLEDAGDEPTTDMMAALQTRPMNLDFAARRETAT